MCVCMCGKERGSDRCIFGRSKNFRGFSVSGRGAEVKCPGADAAGMSQCEIRGNKV